MNPSENKSPVNPSGSTDHGSPHKHINCRLYFVSHPLSPSTVPDAVLLHPGRHPRATEEKYQSSPTSKVPVSKVQLYNIQIYSGAQKSLVATLLLWNLQNTRTWFANSGSLALAHSFFADEWPCLPCCIPVRTTAGARAGPSSAEGSSRTIP